MSCDEEHGPGPITTSASRGRTSRGPESGGRARPCLTFLPLALGCCSPGRTVRRPTSKIPTNGTKAYFGARCELLAAIATALRAVPPWGTVGAHLAAPWGATVRRRQSMDEIFAHFRVACLAKLRANGRPPAPGWRRGKGAAPTAARPWAAAMAANADETKTRRRDAFVSGSGASARCCRRSASICRRSVSTAATIGPAAAPYSGLLRLLLH